MAYRSREQPEGAGDDGHVVVLGRTGPDREEVARALFRALYWERRTIRSLLDDLPGALLPGTDADRARDLARTLREAGAEARVRELGTWRRLTIQLDARSEHVDRASTEVGRFLEEAGAGPGELGSLAAAVREAIQNAVVHGCEEDPTLSVRVVVVVDRDRLEVTVEDPGPGFDAEAVLEKVRSLPDGSAGAEQAAEARWAEGRRGGLGLLVIRRAVDDLSYNERGNRLTLRKRLTGE